MTLCTQELYITLVVKLVLILFYLIDLVFLIYERNQVLGSGHTDKLHIALGYLPNKRTNFAFSIDGTDNFKIKLCSK